MRKQGQVTLGQWAGAGAVFVLWLASMVALVAAMATVASAR